MDDSELKVLVKKSYGNIAKKGGSCCPTKGSCCGTLPPEEISKGIGYSEKEMNAVPQGANLGLGCGNPIALASINAGETVRDLGSGAGFDSFLAASRVGPTGKVIGVDMTPEMINKARENAAIGSYGNVQFVPGELEDLPVEDNSVDVVISNCVINLVPDKKKAFKEAYRVLKPGGRLMVSDLVLRLDLPLSIKNSIEGYVGCISGAVMKDVYLDAIRSAGFDEVAVIEESAFNGFADSVSSIKVRAIKPL
jgi:SAM-dependent methyltransferase